MEQALIISLKVLAVDIPLLLLIGHFPLFRGLGLLFSFPAAALAVRPESITILDGQL